MDYTDHVSLGIETKVCLNFPKPRFGIIPVNLALALVRFSATVRIHPYAFDTSLTCSALAYIGDTTAICVYVHIELCYGSRKYGSDNVRFHPPGLHPRACFHLLDRLKSEAARHPESRAADYRAHTGLGDREPRLAAGTDIQAAERESSSISGCGSRCGSGSRPFAGRGRRAKRIRESNGR